VLYGCRIQVTMLPLSLGSATRRMMKPDSIARDEAVFGNEFVEHYGGTREHEVKLWNEAVTNWEGENFIFPCVEVCSSSAGSGALSRISMKLLRQILLLVVLSCLIGYKLRFQRKDNTDGLLITGGV
jgi:Glutamine synthetase, catalytic domain